MSEEIANDPSVNFTQNAAAKARELIENQNKGDLKLRVYLYGGGCAGIQCGFHFEKEAKDDDFPFETDGVILLVDPNSMQFLDGATIDYTKGEAEEKFVVRDLNMPSGCGGSCGTCGGCG